MEKKKRRQEIFVEDVARIEENSMGFYIKDKEDKLLAEVVREGLYEENEDPRNIKDEVVQKHKTHLKKRPCIQSLSRKQGIYVMKGIAGYGCGKATLRKKQKDYYKRHRTKP